VSGSRRRENRAGNLGRTRQFTDDGTRCGLLSPAHYDDYVEYVVTVVNFIARQGIAVWATTIANEPDGGDGNQIPPDGLAEVTSVVDYVHSRQPGLPVIVTE
jgi:O-glycosyl hydrolase